MKACYLRRALLSSAIFSAEKYVLVTRDAQNPSAWEVRTKPGSTGMDLPCPDHDMQKADHSMRLRLTSL